MSARPVDVFTAARAFLDKHGRDVALEISEQAEDEMIDAGNLMGVATWRGIRSAIFQLTRHGGDVLSRL